MSRNDLCDCRHVRAIHTDECGSCSARDCTCGLFIKQGAIVESPARGPEPYYQDGAVTIYHGDCLDVLDRIALNCHAVLMDPPYASGARTEAAKASSGSMVRGLRWAAKPIENDQMTTTGFVWLMREVARRLALPEGGALLAFIDWRQWPNLVGALESTNLRVNGMVVWDKLSMGLGNGFRAQHELICFASNGVPRVVDRGVGNVLGIPRDDNSDHPSPKPIALIERLLEVITEPGDCVLDPFMGCGPTLVAAKNLGRRAVGIEIDERYCAIAAGRCSQEILDFGSDAESA